MAKDRYALFKSVVPFYMSRLMQDFDCTSEDAAAVFGNAGHECAGFTLLQEQKPTVAGSRGGFGWFQWTGPRRRNYEAYCKRNNLNPSAHESNYAFLVVELRSTEKAMPYVKSASGLNSKTAAFEQRYERAGVKHYASRYKYAEIALAAYNEATRTGRHTIKPGNPKVPSKAGQVAKDVAKAGTGGAAATAAAWSISSTLGIAVAVVVVLGIIGFAIYKATND
jgi:uncharacterized protein YukE